MAIDLLKKLEQESIGKRINYNGNNYNNMYKSWIRNIKVILTSKINGQQKIFENGINEFYIDINGSKYLALNKDKGTLTISNLPYDFLIELITFEYYIIEIFIGYGKDKEPERYLKGEVSYISQKVHTNHDVYTYITYASTYVARFSQSRINFNLNSGINLYAAIKYISDISGMGDNVKISPSLKNYFTSQVITNYAQAGTLIDQIAAMSNEYFELSTDESQDGFYIDCTKLSDKRRIIIDPNIILIGKGNPTISSAGLKITFLPMFNFKPGDIIKIPNSLIDASISDAEDVTSTFNPNFISPTGEYMIREIKYHFQNRGQTFELNITAIAINLLKNIAGSQ